MNEIYLVEVGGNWEEMTLAEMLQEAYHGWDFGHDISDRVRLYTGVDDIHGNKIFDKDEVVEHGHYVNSDRIMTQTISFKPNHGAWLRGDYQRLTPKNVKQYKIEVMKR